MPVIHFYLYQSKVSKNKYEENFIHTVNLEISARDNFL